MDSAKKQYLGYLKYEGELVNEGLMDARKSAQALLGFDECIRFFVGQLAPVLKNVDFEIPVRIRKGSWEALIPDTIIKWIQLGLGAAGTAYIVKAGQKMADKDFDDIGLKDVFKMSLKAIQWTIRIGKHLGNITKKKFENVKFRNDNTEIGIPNSEGEILFVPKEYLYLYVSINSELLRNISFIVEDERRLVIGVQEDNGYVEETITTKYRAIFTQEEETEEVLFPELEHGQNVTLVGEVTRGNGITNSVGFLYKGYVLSAYPKSGSIVRFKHSLFLKARIYGTISRLDDKGQLGARKPKIIFQNIEPIEKDSYHFSLFDGDV
ncbi:MAG: hypothetical protein K6T65_14915 [Peptococcaceae bacterium]|nr:hypothetical protein [Peptococcaceae bacterium]